ncbi:MAG TPA: tRNA uridine-5-carboxymethylaminomethyl(34) synthesis GTPase MnmE [Terriglobia bacterium]|nr:tRNA uridine-5-carboxymethylaminomethyl(34) synthesis GTPase MnmE [Terriglobia bacterium]
MISDDTIAAIATPAGRGGVGMVRLSGPRAIEITHHLIRMPETEIRQATLSEFLDPESGKILDQVVVTCFRKPHSYTGEDVAEICCHGAPVILRFLLQCCLAQCARPAEPGEFTQRAFLNGRIDLTQAEAIRDLIDSRTLFQARVAARQMGGAVAARLKPHKTRIVELIAHLEAGIDFAEDDVPVSGWEDILSRLGSIQTGLEEMAKGYDYGRIVREGLSLAIVGRPNVGKSSLFNRLLNEERAIVTEIPGTTRDLVTETANLNGIPLRLADTAGIRKTEDPVEKIGVERSFQAVADSDLRLLVIDSSQDWTAEDCELLQRMEPLGPILIAFNKCDLPPRNNEEIAAARETIRTSALNGKGIAQLKERLLSLAAPAREPDSEFLTNVRHQHCVQQALASLGKARNAAAQHVPHEMLLLDLYDALHAVDEITGITTTDDVLGVIFSTFCVGK